MPRTTSFPPPASITLYDGDGKRVEKSVSGSVTKIYWYDPSGNVLDETDGTGSATNSAFNEYVFFGGQRIARRDSSNDAFYYFADHLGTSRTIAEIPAGLSTATLCYDADFYPYGGERPPLINTCSQNYKFTGKERDSESGLDNFGARYNSSQWGRFMSPDDSFIGWDQYDPQTLNIYSYTRNNPLNMLDDDGHDPNYAGNCDSLWCLLSELWHALSGGDGSHEDVTTHIISDNPDFSNPANNRMLSQQIPGQNNLSLGNLSTGGRRTMVDAFKSTSDTEISIASLFIFPEGDIEEILIDTERAASPQISVGARAIAKKLGHALSEGYKSAFDGIPATQAGFEEAVREILTHPSSVRNLGKYTEVYDAAGRGVRLEKGTNKYITLVEGSKATPPIP